MSAVAVEIRPPLWRRLLGFNALTAIVLGIVGYYLGWFIGHHIHGVSVGYFADIDQNDISVFLGYFLGVVGFLHRPRLRRLPVGAAARLSAVAAREGDAGHRAATSGSAPTTRSSASSTSAASASSSSSAA